jgi:glycerol-3-phosphate acyltransferase PlsY
MKMVLLALAAFLIGSIPTGQIIAAGSGVDLRKTGSGNIGTTNVLRSVGRIQAFFTLAGDMLKGVAAVLLAGYFDVGILYKGIIGLVAVFGHNFSIFLKFKGGKGVATSLGVLLIYSPIAASATIILWLMTVTITRYSSLGAIVSFFALPFNIYFLDEKAKLPVALVMSILLLLRHSGNVRRLVQGTEPRVGGTA